MTRQFISGHPLEHCDLNNMITALRGNGVITEPDSTSLAVTGTGGSSPMGVYVAIGKCRIDHIIESEVGIRTLTIDPSHATLDRKDLIVYDASADHPAVIKGNNHSGGDADPVYPPYMTSDDILLAIVAVDASETSITSANITDCRIFVDEGGVWHYSGTRVFSATTSTAGWTDLNISSVVGTNRAIAILKVRHTTASSAVAFAFRPNGDSDQYYKALGTTALPTPTNFDLAQDQAALVTAITDANGIVEYYAEAAVAATVDVVAWSRLLV